MSCLVTRPAVCSLPLGSIEPNAREDTLMSRGRSGDNVRTHRRRRIHRDARGRIDPLPTAPLEAEDSDDDEID